MIVFSSFLDGQKILRRPDAPEAPLVSVIMPTCRIRPGKTNERAIQSVLDQSFRDFEFIIVDDGSLDDLNDILMRYQGEDARVVVIRHERNSGLPGLRVDEALLAARGRYAAYQFDDDGWESHCLEALLESMEKAGGEAFVFGTSMMEMRASDGSIRYRPLGDRDLDYGELLHNNLFANNSILHPISSLEVCGMYDPHILMRRLCDYDLWLRMARVLPAVRCPVQVSTVYAEQEHSLGKTVDYHLFRTRTYMQRDRNALLRPSRIMDYDIVDLSYVHDGEERDRIQRSVIVPFVQRYAALFDEETRNRALVSSPVKKRFLITKKAYSTAIDVVLGHFFKSADSAVYSQAFLGEGLLHLAEPDTYDVLCLFKTVDKQGLAAARRAQSQGKPVFYAIDDNYLRFSELGAEFDYLRPGAPRYETMLEQLKLADAVLSFNTVISEDCAEHNPRVMQLHQMIPAARVRRARPPRRGDGKVRYLINTGPARRQELAVLWPTIAAFAVEHADRVQLHVHGIDPAAFGQVPEGTSIRPFNNCYDQYLEELCRGEFDFVICPLFDENVAKRSKSLVKYLEATAMGALGLFSDSFPYEPIQDGVHGLKVGPTPEAWREALERSLDLTEEARCGMVEAARAHVLDNFTTERWFLRFAAALEAGFLHARLGSRRAADGRARIAYFFHETVLGGASLHLLQHAMIARRHGFEPILCVKRGTAEGSDLETLAAREGMRLAELAFDFMLFAHEPRPDEVQRASEIAEFLVAEKVALVHVAIYNASAMLAAAEAGVPCVVTLHKHYSMDYARELGLKIDLPKRRPVTCIHSSSALYAKEWSAELRAPARAFPCPIGQCYFDAFPERRRRSVDPVAPVILISGTLQKRKGQLLAIQALLRLRERGLKPRLWLLGYETLRPEYVKECRSFIAEHGLEKQVDILGFSLDPKPIYEQADYLLCASDEESMPQTILKAMASGLRIISTPIAGVPEVVRDGFSGILSSGYTSDDLAEAMERALRTDPWQWDAMLCNAHETARTHCHEEVVAYQLLAFYNEALRVHKGRSETEWRKELNRLEDHLPRIETVLELFNQLQSVAYVYRVTDETGDVQPAEPLPAGWSRGYHPELQTNYWWHDGSTERPLRFAVKGRHFHLRMLGNPKTRAITMRLAGVDYTIKTFSERPGGRWVDHTIWAGDVLQRRLACREESGFELDPTSLRPAASVASAPALPVAPDPEHDQDTAEAGLQLLAPLHEIVASPPLRPRRVYRVLPAEDGLCAITVVCGTHERTWRGELQLTIRLNGEAIRRAVVDMESLCDNYTTTFCFCPIMSSRGKDLELIFEAHYRDREGAVSLYEIPAASRSMLDRIRHRVLHQGGCLHCELHYERKEVPV